MLSSKKHFLCVSAGVINLALFIIRGGADRYVDAAQINFLPNESERQRKRGNERMSQGAFPDLVWSPPPSPPTSFPIQLKCLFKGYEANHRWHPAQWKRQPTANIKSKHHNKCQYPDSQQKTWSGDIQEFRPITFVRILSFTILVWLPHSKISCHLTRPDAGIFKF